MLDCKYIEQYVLSYPKPTYDPYDIWNTYFGQKVKQNYYRNKWLGSLPAALLTLFDFYINNNYRIGYKARNYPMVHAYRALILIELYKADLNESYLGKVRESLDWLKQNYSKGYSGYCWGANMPWVSKNAIYTENTPFITNTPYILEAFINFQQVSQTEEYNDLIQSVFNFLDKDLLKIIDDEYYLALSYSPEIEKRIVINANSYAMFSYALLSVKNNNLKTYIIDKIMRIYAFLTKNQQQNGSWFYFADNNPGNFIDCFHSCFILKNIYKVNQILELDQSKGILSRGYNYLKTNFWDSNRKLFRRFSITDRASFVKFDLYDNAEMLNLAILLQDNDMISVLHSSIIENFFSGNDIYSQIIFPNRRINKNTLRWAVMPLLYSLVKSNFKFSGALATSATYL